MALAPTEGLALKDMEFLLYLPPVLPVPVSPCTDATRGEGGHLKNSEGERFLVERDYGVGNKAELGPRDMISRAIVQEIEAGRGLEGPYGQFVHLDLTHLGEAAIDKKLPMVRELSKIYVGVDPVYEPIPIRPVLHYMMGGVDTDIDGATTLPGLYAAGETACVSLNGANRLGSNSLTECLVFGARAGQQAVAYAKGSDDGNEAAYIAQAEEEAARIEAARAATGGSEKIAQIRREMHETMESGCGVYRQQDTMDATVAVLGQLRERMSDVRLEDDSKVFNTELTAALELDNMLMVAEALAVSAAHRKESRGAHTRRDATTRDDQNYLYHTLCYRDSAGPRLDKKEVTLGTWVPEERKY
jgi:fumarate reductase flavoprotein subunit